MSSSRLRHSTTKITFTVAFFLASACALHAQLGQTSDWWSYAGDAQRVGWEKTDQKFAKADVPNFRLLWKMKIASNAAGPRTLMAPVIVGNLIGSRGFKELAFVAGDSGQLARIAAGPAPMYWEKDVGYSPAK